MSEKELRDRFLFILNEESCKINSISLSSSEQRKLNRQINEGATITSEVIFKFVDTFPQYSIEWLLTGRGEMYKTEYNAGRDNNVVNGKNSGVVGNSGIIGNMVAE